MSFRADVEAACMVPDLAAEDLAESEFEGGERDATEFGDSRDAALAECRRIKIGNRAEGVDSGGSGQAGKGGGFGAGSDDTNAARALQTRRDGGGYFGFSSADADA